MKTNNSYKQGLKCLRAQATITVNLYLNFKYLVGT